MGSKQGGGEEEYRCSKQKGCLCCIRQASPVQSRKHTVDGKSDTNTSSHPTILVVVAQLDRETTEELKLRTIFGCNSLTVFTSIKGTKMKSKHFHNFAKGSQES